MARHTLSLRFLTFVSTSFLLYTIVSAIPVTHNSVRHATHRTRGLPRGLRINSYHPVSSYQTFDSGLDHPYSKRAVISLPESAAAFVQQHLGISSDSIHVHSAYESEIAGHVYMKQQIHNLTVANAVANVAFNKANQVVAFGSSFVNHTQAPSPVPKVDVQAAITKAEDILVGTYDNSTYPAPTLEYLVKEDGTLALTHALHVTNETAGTFYEAFVDAHTGELVSVTDFVARSTYRVLPMQKQVLTEGFEDLTDPSDPAASPLGWHNDGRNTFNTTAGNNAIAYQLVQGNPTVESADPLQFLFTQDPTQEPTVAVNLDAARTNAFYLVNSVHDLAYRYGFTESAFNFQTNNFNKGGMGNDRITVSVQQSPGYDNAFFATMKDGINGQMQMYIWDKTTPKRDGALENDIVIHENTHGITNRMTGGGTASCLQTTEAGGLGEGWSDAMADWVHQDSSITDFVIGPYVSNNSSGLRTHPYSTSATTNPLKYSSVAGLTDVHAIGEIWANILHNILAALVSAHGFSSDARTNPSGTGGNVVFLHLFLDALPIQPCNPTFVNARDAWIQADVNRYRGANKCTLWQVFASRGLGSKAKNYVDDFTLPRGC